MSDVKFLKPKYLLEDIKRLLEEDRYTITVSGQQTAHSIGFSATQIREFLLTLERDDFGHSITEYYNKKIRQDVYKKMHDDIRVYIKLKITQIPEESLLVLFFKKDESR